MGTDRDGFLKIRPALASILWSILAGAIVFGYHQMRTTAEMQSSISGMSRDVAGLARGVASMEKRLDLEAQSRYTVGDAAKDYALVNARQAEHERRLQRLEAGKR